MTATGLVEPHLRGQARDLIAILRKHVRQHGVLARRNLLRQVNLLGQLRVALLERAVEIHVLDLIAQIRFLIYERYQAVFDLQVDFGASSDVFLEGAGGDDGEGFATTFCRVNNCIHLYYLKTIEGEGTSWKDTEDKAVGDKDRHVRCRWVGIQVDFLNDQDVVVRFCAEEEWVFARYAQVVAVLFEREWLLLLAAYRYAKADIRADRSGVEQRDQKEFHGYRWVEELGSCWS